MWANSGTGNPYICPVCRQDVGRSKRRLNRLNSSGDGVNGDESTGEEERRHNREESSLFTRIVANTTGPSMLLRPVNNTQPNYNTIQTRVRTTPFAPLSHPTLRRLHPMFGLSAVPPIPEEGLNEQTPLFSQTSVATEDDDDY